MSKSVKRVEDAVRKAGLDVEILRMPDSTRTAEEAALACGCETGQIVKSLIFQQVESEDLKLLMVSGEHSVNLSQAAEQVGGELVRADPKVVRLRTGFAIGGVAPVGHLTPIESWIDEHLSSYETVWVAAGAPNAVFEINPRTLEDLTGARRLQVKGG